MRLRHLPAPVIGPGAEFMESGWVAQHFDSITRRHHRADAVSGTSNSADSYMPM